MSTSGFANNEDRLLELNRAARQAMAAGRHDDAVTLLRQALEIDRQMPSLWLNYAAALRHAGDTPSALAATDEALQLQPRDFNALLMKARLLDRPGNEIAAGRAYSVALMFRPSTVTDPGVAATLARGAELEKAYLDGMVRTVDEVVAALPADLSDVEASNLRRFADLQAGRTRTYLPAPNQYYVPGLPSHEFFPRSLFPWIEALEAQTVAIRGELEMALRDFPDLFIPYVNEDPSTPLDQWRALNRSPDWSSLQLFVRGETPAGFRDRFPATYRALAQIPQARVPGRSPAAMFSALKPGIRIPPHVGVSNARLVVHLPLIIPPDCGFRVGSETRQWKVGEAWVFDDTIEHEAWNNSHELRVILIADIWNVFMTEAERATYSAMVQAIDKYNGDQTGFGDDHV